MDLENLNSTLTVLMRTISNPMTNSTLPVWCYMDYPREDVSVPRISITQTSGAVSQLGIGDATENTLGVMMETTYDLDVWVKQGTKSLANMGGTQLRDHIGDLVIQKILDNRSTICTSTNEIIDIQITGIVTQPFVDEFEWHRKTISIRITHLQSHI